MQIGVSSFVYDKFLKTAEFTKVASLMGFKAVEIGLGNNTNLEILSKPLAILKFLNSYSTVASVHFPYKFIGENKTAEYFDLFYEMEHNPQGTSRLFTKVCEFAGQLNAPILVIHGGKKQKKSRSGSHDYLVRAIKSLIEVAEDKSVKIALENSDAREDRLCQTITELEYVFNEVNSDHFGICFDTAHAFSCKIDIAPAIHRLRKSIVHFHLNDSKGGVGWEEHIAIGHGLINWKETFHAIQEVSFSGIGVLESGSADNRIDTDSAVMQQKKFINGVLSSPSLS